MGDNLQAWRASVPFDALQWTQVLKLLCQDQRLQTAMRCLHEVTRMGQAEQVLPRLGVEPRCQPGLVSPLLIPSEPTLWQTQSPEWQVWQVRSSSAL
mmetsp:Transcript_84351/g.204576  ORF Transcript_84351/g.204576 Transcript_84351/m.204576 type:complete len:97 (-) Transcript_84351:416-706(-)